MDDKIINLDKSLEKVFERADEKCDRGEYLSALSSLLNEHFSRPYNLPIIAHLADIYTELGLYENAVVLWFKFLLSSNKRDYWEAYNGLGANYYFLERFNLAGYYFNEQLRDRTDTTSVYEDVLDEYIDKLNAEHEKKRFTIVKDKTAEEEAESVIERARKLNGISDYDLAIQILNKVDENCSKYGEAVYEQGVSYLLKGDLDNAIERVSKALSVGYLTVSAISIMIDLDRAISGNNEQKYIKMLVDYLPKDDEDKYKKLTALCEYDIYDKAEILADELLSTNPFDTNTAYVKGFLRYNAKDYLGAENYFKTAYLLSLSYQARFYLRLSQKAKDGNPVYDKLRVSFKIPSKDIQEKTEYIENLISGKVDFTSISEEEIIDVAEWCLTSGEENLQFSLCYMLVLTGKKQLIAKVKEFLVNPSASDVVKQGVVSVICDCTTDSKVAVVYDNLYSLIRFNRPNFGEENGRVFKKAYSKVIGRLSAFNVLKLHRLSDGASEIFSEFVLANKVGEVTDSSALACAMYFYSGLNIFKHDDTAYKVFDTDKESVDKIFDMLKNI